MKYEFSCKGEIFEWRGPAPFYFVRVNKGISLQIKERARALSYGWGVVHVHGEINGTPFDSALMPKDGLYLVPIKDAIRKVHDLEVDDTVNITFNLGKR